MPNLWLASFCGLMGSVAICNDFERDKKAMYAIFADGGRQYKVSVGQVLDLDFRDNSAGEVLTFDQILAVSTDAGSKFGAPTVPGAKDRSRSGWRHPRPQGRYAQIPPP